MMNEKCLKGHDYSGTGDYKFVMNFWNENLNEEHRRIKALNIGEITEIRPANPKYYYFQLRDTDNNVIEVTEILTKK